MIASQHALETAATKPEQPNRDGKRAYTISQLLSKLSLPKSTFFDLRAKGQLPFLEELRPRLGRTVRYRADLVDRYLAGNWQTVGVHGRECAKGARSSGMTLSSKSCGAAR